MLLPIIASADAVEIDGIKYELNATEKTASVVSGNSRDIVIPSSVTYENDSYVVTSIGERAFYGFDIKSISIPNSVTSIGDRAFESCWWLEAVYITDLTAWCNIKFAYYTSNPCYNAAHLFLNGVEIIDLVIPNGITYIRGYAFYGCRLTSISIPNSVTTIEYSAFSYCRSLTSVSIPNSVTSIGNSAFYGCSSLASVSIPNSVTSIGNSTFYGCSSLTSISIPNSVTSIGNYAFRDCYRLTTIYCLNPTPPTCDGTSTFASENQRDKYDVYNYATLHVPMGSGELYSSAYEWRYFNKIKEDMELDGKVYYARLTVKQGTTGYTSQPVKASETYTIYIGSLGENKVNAVTFNGEDVTDEIKNGYYTTPEIKGESELSISYVSGTALNSVVNNNTRVTGYDGEIRITNIDSPSDIFVYTVDGQLVGNITSAFGNATMSVSKNQVYLVKIGTNVYKLAM